MTDFRWNEIFILRNFNFDSLRAISCRNEVSRRQFPCIEDSGDANSTKLRCHLQVVHSPINNNSLSDRLGKNYDVALLPTLSKLCISERCIMVKFREVKFLNLPLPHNENVYFMIIMFL